MPLFLLFLSVLSFANLDTNTYLQQIDNLKLYEQPAWLYSLYYQKRIDGYTSRVDGESFFLHPNGKFSPQEEMKSDLIAFLEPLEGDERKHAQCMFPARRNFLFSHLKIPDSFQLPCAYWQGWKNFLAVEKVALIFASSYMNNPSSIFGHTFMKLESRNKTNVDLMNYVVDFSAQTKEEQGVEYALKGIFGFYPGKVSLVPYHLKIREYSAIEGRDIWTYEFNLTPAEIDMLLNLIIELETTHMEYYYFDENCSHMMMALLQAIRPQQNFMQHLWFSTIPADTIQILNRKTNFVQNRFYRPSLARQFYHNWKNTNASVKDVYIKKDFKSVDYQRLSDKEKAQALDLQIDQYSILSLKGILKEEEKLYELKLLRSKLGLQNYYRPLPHPHFSIEDGDASSNVSLGYVNWLEKDFASFRFLPAYQEALTRPLGYDWGNAVELLSGTILYDIKDKQIRFERLDLVHILASPHFDLNSKMYAWTVDIAAKNADVRNHTSIVTHLDAGVGVATQWHDASLLKSTILSKLNMDWQPHASENIKLYPSILLRTQAFFDPWAFLLDMEKFWFQEPDWQIHYKMNYSLKLDWQVGIEWIHYNPNENRQSILLHHSF